MRDWFADSESLMEENKATGRCLCGRIKYQTDAPPRWIGHCHCESCRRQTGAAVATFVGYAEGDVEFVEGTRAMYDSSPGVRRGFCAACGTPLSYEADRFPGEVHLYVSTLDHPERFVPQFHVYYGEKIPWLEVRDALPRYKTTSYDGEDITQE